MAKWSEIHTMELVDVYNDLNAIPFLYELLRQRDIDTVSLSHRVMPTVEDHIEFYRSKPYRWFFFSSSIWPGCGAASSSRNTPARWPDASNGRWHRYR